MKKCGIKESVDKASPPAEIMTFLCVLFNTRTMTIEVTPECLDEIRKLIEQWLGKEYATLEEIQSLLGKLNFVPSCVKPSRIFISRLLSWLRSLLISQMKRRVYYQSMLKKICSDGIGFYLSIMEFR